MLGLVCGDGPEVTHDFGEEDLATKRVGDIYQWFKKEFGSAKCQRIRARFQREMEAEASGRELSEQDRMQRQHAKCDALAGKTSARTAEMIWDAIEAEKRK